MWIYCYKLDDMHVITMLMFYQYDLRLKQKMKSISFTQPAVLSFTSNRLNVALQTFNEGNNVSVDFIVYLYLVQCLIVLQGSKRCLIMIYIALTEVQIQRLLTIDHETLLGYIKSWFCVSFVDLQYFALYLCDLYKIGSTQSDSCKVVYRVPQAMFCVRASGPSG